jgi:hypothetical protein
MEYEVLRALYPNALERAGRVYPVAISPLSATLADVVQSAGEAYCDGELLALGHPHLDVLLRDRPFLHNGRILCWDSSDSHSITASAGRYLDMIATCDAIRDEFEKRNGIPPFTLRERAHKIAIDPLSSGSGRAAGIGVSVILTTQSDIGSQRNFLLGFRSNSVGTDSGLWHVAPSGMLEPTDMPGLEAMICRELEEEVGISMTPAEVAHSGRVIGLAHDLLRLRPDIVVQLDIASPVDLSGSTEEFGRFVTVAIESGPLEAFWESHAPTQITPPAAGAVALLEKTLLREPRLRTELPGRHR